MEEQDKKNVIEEVAREIAQSFFRGEDTDEFEKLVKVAIAKMEFAIMPLIP